MSPENDERRPVTGAATTAADVDDNTGARRARPSAAELLATPGAYLSRTDLRDLGWPRRAVDAIFRELAIVALPGFSRPMIAAADYVELVERSTYRDDRVRAL